MPTPDRPPPPALTSIRLGRATSVLRALTLLTSALFVLSYIVLVILRVRYPYELEWLEGAAVDHVSTVRSGHPLYARPSLSFTPLTYTPGYFYLAAGISFLTGEGFLPLRLISIVASAGVLVLMYRLVYRDTRSASAGLLAVGLFAAMYGWTDAWFDLARTDSLMLLLALASIAVLRGRHTPVAALLAGLLVGACFLVKQTGAVIAVPLALWCLFNGWRTFAAFVAPVLLIVIGTTWLFNLGFDGWYSYYVFSVPAQHPLSLDMLWGFWRFDLLRPQPIALLMSVGTLLWRIRRQPASGLFDLMVTLALCGGAWASRLHSLSYVNVAIPAYAAIAMMFAKGCHELATVARERAPQRVRPVIPAAIYGLALLQLLHLRYDPRRYVPTAQDVATGQRFVETLAAIPGPVFVPYHGYLQTLAGKERNAHAVVIADVIRGGRTAVEAEFERELIAALSEHRFAAVIAPERSTPVAQWLPIAEFYRPMEPVVPGNSRFWRPEVRYVAR